MKTKLFKTISLGRGLSVLRSPFSVLLIALAMAVGCDKDEKDAAVAVTGVTVSPTTHELAVGGTFTFTAAVTPDNASDKSVTWTSSSTATATVSTTGLVEAIAPGTATITATANDGSGKTGTATVTVSATPPPLAIDKTTIDAPFAGGAYEVAVTTATGDIEWTATVNTEASAWVTLTNAGATGNDTVTVTVTANLTTTANTANTGATITFTAGDVTKTVTVTQAAAPAPLTFCEKCGWNGSEWVNAYVTTYYYPFDGSTTTTKPHLFAGDTPNVTGATSDKDGRANTAVIDAVAVEGDVVRYCKALGSGWYLPAYEEVINISGGTVNVPLNGQSGLGLLDVTHSDFFHTSTIGADEPTERTNLNWNTWDAQAQVKVAAGDGNMTPAPNGWENGFHCFWQPE